MDAQAQPPQPSQVPAQAKPGSLRDWFEKGMLILVLAILAAALIEAFVAINAAIATWFSDRWVPVGSAVFALVVAGACLVALGKLTGRKLW
jgi:hypothetical protein